MNVSATEAKNKLGQMLERAQSCPVTIEKSGRRHSVLISAEHFDALVAAAKPQAQPRGKRKAEPGRDFYAQHKAWVDAQNNLVDRFGIPGEQFRPW